MIKAVLFDVFGTLIDVSTDDYLSPFSHVLLPLELERADRRRAGRMLCTEPFPTIQDYANRLEQMYPGKTIPASSLDAAIAELEQDLGRMVEVDGACQLLSELKRSGLKLALVSNLASIYEQVIRRYSVDQAANATVYSFEVGYQKPEPQIYEIALQRLGVAAEETVMIGDDPVNDGEGPKAVGIRARVIQEGYTDGGASLERAVRWVLTL